MSNKFCRFMSNGTRVEAINGQLVWSPCCWYMDKHSINSTFPETRSKINQSTTWLPGCETCKQFEHHHPTELSLRKSSFIRIPETDSDDCVNLEISFDKRCNAACMSCGSKDSTTWRKFEKKHQLFSMFVNSEDDVDSHLEQVFSTFPMESVKYLVFQGGEPFFSDLHVKVLEYLIRVNKNPKDIFINYTTNGGIFPDKTIINLWKNFREVLITFSVDGTGDKFEYLRWPLKWDKVKTTVEHFVNETDAILEVTYTISALNLLYWDETLAWIKDTIPMNRIHGGEIKPPNRAMGIMDPSTISDEYKAQVLEKYGQDHFITNMVMNLPRVDLTDRMVKYFDKIDGFRGLEWRHLFPEAARFLDPPVVQW